MELDKRIKEGKRPLTCIDVEQAREFEGKQCLFSDLFGNYKNIREYAKYPQYTGVLHIGEEKQILSTKQEYVFRNLTDGYLYSLCLPLEWVKPEEPEKTYRPFDIKEFIKKYSVGSVFLIRRKREEMTETCVQYVGYKIFQQKIYLGITDFTLDELFENFEICINGEWQPFGVIDE